MLKYVVQIFYYLYFVQASKFLPKSFRYDDYEIFLQKCDAKSKVLMIIGDLNCNVSMSEAFNLYFISIGLGLAAEYDEKLSSNPEQSLNENCQQQVWVDDRFFRI